MAGIGHHLGARREARLADLQPLGPEVDLVAPRQRGLGHVGLQQLEHQLLRLAGALAGGLHDHAVARCAAARRRQHALAVDLDHARAAVAHRVEPVLVAQVRDANAIALGHVENRLAGARLHLAPIERRR